jgi:hypothetical protein
LFTDLPPVGKGLKPPQGAVFRHEIPGFVDYTHAAGIELPGELVEGYCLGFLPKRYRYFGAVIPLSLDAEVHRWRGKGNSKFSEFPFL